MTKTEIYQILLAVRQAYTDSLEGKTVSLPASTGAPSPITIRSHCAELDYWERRWRAAQVAADHTNSLIFSKAPHGIFEKTLGAISPGCRVTRAKPPAASGL